MEEVNPYLITRMQDHQFSIFAEMSILAAETNAINLGQGFPDTDGPKKVTEAAIQAIRDGRNQYPPDRGIEQLRTAVAEHQRRFYSQIVDPKDVVISTGAAESLSAATLALVSPGDEVVLFEPYFDLYASCISLAGGIRKTVTLREPDYSFDIEELAKQVTSRTRFILLNTPHNPTGKVFSLDEMQKIAQIAIDNDVLVVTDEVYEHMTYDGREHIPIATLPGMAERTLTVSSAGKSFGLTGWKIGWCHGPTEITKAVHTVKQNLTFASGAPFQPAIAAALALDDGYFEELAADLCAKRDLISDGLSDIGFEVFPAFGTYYVTADVRPLGYEDGMSFCLDIPKRCGVVAVPTEVFYDHPTAGKSIVRFAYCKQPDVLNEAIEKLSVLKV